MPFGSSSGRDHQDSAARGVHSGDMEATYKSGRALAVATVVLLTVMTMLMLAHEALHKLTMRQLGTFDADGAGARLALLSTLVWSAAVAQLATFVLFLMWVYRATANLPALGAGSTRFTPAGAVKVFFIPFVGWVRVYQVMAMIWTESQPRALTNAGYPKSRSIFIVIFWYAFLVGGLVVDSLLFARTISTGAVVVVLRCMSFVFDAAAAILFAIMVWKADARQRAQAEDLERLGKLPQPTGSTLR